MPHSIELSSGNDFSVWVGDHSGPATVANPQTAGTASLTGPGININVSTGTPTSDMVQAGNPAFASGASDAYSGTSTGYGPSTLDAAAANVAAADELGRMATAAGVVTAAVDTESRHLAGKSSCSPMVRKKTRGLLLSTLRESPSHSSEAWSCCRVTGQPYYATRKGHIPEEVCGHVIRLNSSACGVGAWQIRLASLGGRGCDRFS
jgi:hypothetical protein